MQNFEISHDFFSHLKIIYLKIKAHVSIFSTVYKQQFFPLIEQPYGFCVVISV